MPVIQKSMAVKRESRTRSSKYMTASLKVSEDEFIHKHEEWYTETNTARKRFRDCMAISMKKST